VLLDLRMPDCQGFSGLLELRAAFPDARIVVVSASEDPETVRRALAQRALAERATVEWIEKEATELGYDCDADEAVPDFMRRVCRERDEARALAGRLVDNGDRP